MSKFECARSLFLCYALHIEILLSSTCARLLSDEIENKSEVEMKSKKNYSIYTHKTELEMERSREKQFHNQLDPISEMIFCCLLLFNAWERERGLLWLFRTDDIDINCLETGLTVDREKNWKSFRILFPKNIIISWEKNILFWRCAINSKQLNNNNKIKFFVIPFRFLDEIHLGIKVFETNHEKTF